MKIFCVHMKQKVLDKFLLNVDVFAFLKKKHVHLAFELPLSDSDYFDKVIDLISNEWERQEIFFNNYEMIYARLIQSMKWKFDYVFFFEKKIRAKKVSKECHQ